MKATLCLLLFLAVAHGQGTNRVGAYGPIEYVDRRDNDLPNMPVSATSVDDCQTQCFQRAECVAWAMDSCGDRCWLKGRVGGSVAADCRASGEIRRTSPNRDGSYGYIENLDRRGNDLGGMPVTASSVDDCQKQCYNRADCAAFAMDSCGNRCWLKGSIGESSPADCRMSGVVKRSNGDRDGPHGKISNSDMPNADLPNMPVTATSPEDCQTLCFQRADCVSWAAETCGSRCWLKSARGSAVGAGCRASGNILKTTFRNPILSTKIADPWMIQIGDWYYLTGTTVGATSISLWRSKDLSNFNGAENHVIWTPRGTNLLELWAPELHVIGGKLYIYCAMDENGANWAHRMHVLQADDSANPFGSWTYRGKLMTGDDNWAIDGTILQTNNKLYMIWSGWQNGDTQHTQDLYIAPMSDPLHFSGPRVLLHKPDHDWMKDGDYGIMEGPEVIYHNNRIFVVYSASSSWSSRYSLGFMGIDGGRDPLDANAWWRYDDGPVMQSSNGVYGPGHASFVTDRQGTPYVIYHAMADAGAGWDGRTARAEPFTWNADGSPLFPKSLANFNQDVKLPA